MKRATAIVTDHNGHTSHAAIISRELGLSAIVSTGNVTYVLHKGQDVIVSCTEGDNGFIYEGISNIKIQSINVSKYPRTQTDIMLNLANPSVAYRWWRLPAAGIGLARMEFVITNQIRMHPMALVHFNQLQDAKAKKEIKKLTISYNNKADYFVDKLAHGLATLYASVYPRPAIIRLNDFKTNEYANLISGKQFEPTEENPILGFRGASHYYSPHYAKGFTLECYTIKRLQDKIGFTNAIIMIPFCRTVKEAEKVMGVMEDNGLKRGNHGLQVYVMCEIPSNVILAEEFTEKFDGLSIGSLLSPDVSISELDHLPRVSHVVVLRNCLDAARDSQIKQIYEMFPSLDDSKKPVHGREQGTRREPDSDDIVSRNVFRRFLVWARDTGLFAMGHI